MRGMRSWRQAGYIMACLLELSWERFHTFWLSSTMSILASAPLWMRTSARGPTAFLRRGLASRPPSAPNFPCVGANEARDTRLRGEHGEGAAPTSPLTSCSAGTSTPSFPCVDANAQREARLRSQGPVLFDSARAGLAYNDPVLGENATTQTPNKEPTYTSNHSGYQTYSHTEPYRLDYGGILPHFQIAYETWGTLNEARDNVVLLHTGLSASSHAASTEANPSRGWWEDFLGPGKAVDTNKYFVICTNILGGCYGSTGPSSPYPAPAGSQEAGAWGTRFPILSLFDMVRAQFFLLDSLGIDKVYASVGSSMGGMQSIAAAHLFPERVQSVISISGCARSGPSSVALRYAQRSVLMADPNWNQGFYYGPGQIPPHTGMKLARQIATITYRSGPEWEQRFGRRRRRAPQSKQHFHPPASLPAISTTPATDAARLAEQEAPFEADPALCPDFLIETYLDHQGEAFCLKYDANSLIYVSKAMDLFDMSDYVLRDLERRKDMRRKIEEGVSPEQAVADMQRQAQDEDAEEEELNEALHRSPASKKRRQHISTITSPAGHAYVPALARGLANLRNKPTLVIGVQSDVLFPVEQQRELAECLRMIGNDRVSYYELDAPYGHDSFLYVLLFRIMSSHSRVIRLDVASVGTTVRGFLG